MPSCLWLHQTVNCIHIQQVSIRPSVAYIHWLQPSPWLQAFTSRVKPLLCGLKNCTCTRHHHAQVICMSAPPEKASCMLPLTRPSCTAGSWCQRIRSEACLGAIMPVQRWTEAAWPSANHQQTRTHAHTRWKWKCCGKNKAALCQMLGY